MGESFNSISSIFIDNEFESEMMATVGQPVMEQAKSIHKPATKRRDWNLDDDGGSEALSMEFECWLSFVIERTLIRTCEEYELSYFSRTKLFTNNSSFYSLTTTFLLPEFL